MNQNDQAGGGPLDGGVGRPVPERSVRHLLTPDMIAAEDAAGGVVAAGALARCDHCDDTGDVTALDGEWRGYCACPAGQALRVWSKPPCQQCGAMTQDEALSRCMGARAEGGCHGNDLWPD